MRKRRTKPARPRIDAPTGEAKEIMRAARVWWNLQYDHDDPCEEFEKDYAKGHFKYADKAIVYICQIKETREVSLRLRYC
jgi:hypothetical protein